VQRVVDDDTIRIEATIWLDLNQRAKLWLDGVNIPEKRGQRILACEKQAGKTVTAFTLNYKSSSGKYSGRPGYPSCHRTLGLRRNPRKIIRITLDNWQGHNAWHIVAVQCFHALRQRRYQVIPCLGD